MNITNEYLKKYKQKYGKVHLAFQHDKGWWRHFDYPSKESEWLLDFASEREIFQDEVVFESDMNMKKMNRSVAFKKSKKLINYNIAHSIWWSGNKSYHIHIVFPELFFIINSHDRHTIKRLFLKWMCDFDDKYIASHKVDMQLAGKHLIRFEGCKHPTSHLPKVKLFEHDTNQDNLFPNVIWKVFNKTRTIHTPIKKFEYSKIPESIKYFMNNRFSCCRKRIAFCIYNVLKKSPLKSQAESIVLQWNEMQGNHLSKQWLNATFRNKTDYKISHRYIMDIMNEVKYNGKMDTTDQ